MRPREKSGLNNATYRGSPLNVQRKQTVQGEERKLLIIYLGTVLSLKINRGQDVLAHTCNTNYPGGGDQANQGLKIAWAKRFMRPHLNQQKLGIV
jgi:hypothetical protein